MVGVVRDTRDVRLEDKPQPRFYWHYAFGGAQVVVRARVPAAGLIPVLRDVVRQTDGRVRIDSARPMSEIVDSAVAERRFLTAMVATYAAVALAIACVGIFSVVACQVAQRRNEFGVRTALGAMPGQLVRLVLLQAGRLALLGLAVGIVASFGTNRLLSSQLFGLSPYDPLLLATTSAIRPLCWPASSRRTVRRGSTQCRRSGMTDWE